MLLEFFYNYILAPAKPVAVKKPAAKVPAKKEESSSDEESSEEESSDEEEEKAGSLINCNELNILFISFRVLTAVISLKYTVLKLKYKLKNSIQLEFRILFY